MPAIKIRIGAALDANVASVFAPLEKAAERARKNINKSLKAGISDYGVVMSKEDAKVASSEAKLAAQLEKINKQRLREEVRDEEKATAEKLRAQKQFAAGVQRIYRDISREEERAMRSPGRGGAIGVGRRAAISVGAGTAVAYGLSGSAIHGAIGLADSFLQGVGVETSLAPHLQRAQELREQAMQVVNAGYIPGAAGAQGVLQDPKQIMAEMQDVANKTAFSANDAMSGLQAFVAKTGDLETGRKVLGDMAKLARATGAGLDDMANAAAEVTNNLGDVPDKAAVTAQVMRVIAGQGKLGAVEIKDLAAQMAKLAGVAGTFEGGAAQNIGEMGILAQEAKLRGTATSATMAATSVSSFATDLTKGTTLKHWAKAHDSQGRSLTPFTDKTHTTLRSPEELILEALKYSKGDLQKLGELFPNKMGLRAVRGFAEIYSSTAGDDNAKIQAVVQEFENLRHAQLSAEEVNRAFAAAMDTGKSKVQLANNRLDEMAGKLADAVLPALAGLAPALEALGPPLAGLIGKVSDFLGIKPEAANKLQADTARLTEAGAKELDTAMRQRQVASAGMLGLGEGGAGPGGALGAGPAGSIDPAHLAALEAKSKELAALVSTEQSGLEGAQKAAAERRHSRFSGGRLVANLSGGVFGTSDRQLSNEVVAKKYEIERDKEQLAKTNELLGQIHSALVSGQLKIGAMPSAPPTSDRGGSAPAESPNPG